MRLPADATIRSVDFANGHLILTMADGFRLKQPLSRYPALAKATLDERRAFTIPQDRQSVQWPELDVVVDLATLKKS